MVVREAVSGCAAIGQYAAVRAAVCAAVPAVVRAEVFGSVRQCGSVWQCVRQFVAVRFKYIYTKQ
jgi:hypothetical protein